MKRRFPGDQADPRGPGGLAPGGFRPPQAGGRFPGRGGRGPPPPFGQRGGPPGRFQGRGGMRPPILPGRGPPGPPPGRGPPPPHHMGGRHEPRPPMDRGFHPRQMEGGRGRLPTDMMGRGPSPGRPLQMGRGPVGPGPLMPGVANTGIPPPPPRNGPAGGFMPGRGPPRGGPMHQRLPPPPQMPPQNIPPPPTRPGYPRPQRAGSLPQPVGRLQPPFPQVAPTPPNAGALPVAQNAVTRLHPPHPHVMPAQSPAPPQVAGVYGSVPVALAPAVTAASGVSQQTHMAPTATSSKPTMHTQQQIDAAWKEYTAPSGAKYYHNAILKESTYNKPDTLPKLAPATTTEKRKWQEYVDSSTGKTYYSDGATTTWEKPADFQSTGDEADTTAEQPPRKKAKASKVEAKFANKEEALAAFKGFLLAKGIPPTQKWNEVAKYCSSDPRWAAVEGALSVGERRQALAEYQTKRANELRDEERQEKVRAKDAYVQMLTDVLPTIKDFSAWNSRFADVRSVLTKDDRFHSVAQEGTRESLFLDFCEEYRKRDERKRRNKKREAQDAFLSFLNEREESGSLSFASTWESFMASLEPKDKEDSRIVISSSMTDSDRQLYFADFVIELQAAEDDKRRRIRDARRRAEKAQRDAYRDILRQMAMDGHIRPSTSWRSIEDQLFDEEPFKLVQAQNRDAPQELFELFVNDWDEEYRGERSFLGRLLSNQNHKEMLAKSSSSYDEFTARLLKEAEYDPEIYGDTRRIVNREEPVSTARLYFEELISRANDASQRLAVRRRSMEDSSEDEGEIVEDGELTEDTAGSPKDVEPEAQETAASSPSDVPAGNAAATDGQETNPTSAPPCEA